MSAEQSFPAQHVCRPGAHLAPTLTGAEPGLWSVRTGLQRCGSKGGAGALLTQAGAPAPIANIGPIAADGRSVRSRAPAGPTTTKEGTTTMRRVTRTIQHLIAGSLASQRVARANAATASVTLTARREEREGVDAYLAEHRASRAPAATRASSARTSVGGRTGSWAGWAVQESPGAENLPRLGSFMVPSPRDAPTIGTAVEVEPERRAVVAEAVAWAMEEAR